MAAPQHQTPEWEEPSSSTTKTSIFSKAAILSTFKPKSQQPVTKESVPVEQSEEGTVAPYRRRFPDRLPHWLACFGRSRKVLYIGIAAFLLLALILGLALGLSLKKGKSHQNLPLPTDKGIFTGDLTYYSPGPGYGACGYENTSEEAICAVSHTVWDAVSTSSNPNHNPLCGKKIRITRFHPGENRNNSVDVTVVDRCTGCQPTDIDLSIKMFEILADEEQGRVVGSWAWLD